MYSDLNIAWFAGLFEGEGCFKFSGQKAKSLSIVMTDLDVLQKVQSIFGGTIRQSSRKDGKDHWKDTWVWNLFGRSSIQLVEDIQPYLSERRLNRSIEYLDYLSTSMLAEEQVILQRDAIKSLYAEGGHTHRSIAEDFNLTRSYVSHIIRGRYDT